MGEAEEDFVYLDSNEEFSESFHDPVDDDLTNGYVANCGNFSMR